MKAKRFLSCLYAVLLLLAAFPLRAEASGASTYHPPAITVVAYGAPEDLEVFLEVQKNGERFPVSTVREKRAWETSFRLYREGIYRSNTFWGNDKDFKDSVLIMKSGGEERRIPVPDDFLTPGGNRDVFTYYAGTGELCSGLPAWRAPLTIGLRMLLLLLVKGLIFLLIGYREIRSWLSFLGVNLATQLPLNLSLCNMLLVDDLNLYTALFIGMLVMLLAEIVALVLLVTEKNRNITAIYATAANLAGVAVTVTALSVLPV